ncbi:MAG: hypothetical protein JXA37_03595 [Chloroflexia bacterium]|nr:hypothetical protein [Chloroflexia bacterium]
MEQICLVLWGIVSAAATAANVFVSWLLDNVPAFAGWWNPLPAWLKRVGYAVVTTLLGLAAYAVGIYLASCPGWPDWLGAVYVVLMAAAGWFAGKARHEKARLLDAEDELIRLANALLEVAPDSPDEIDRDVVGVAIRLLKGSCRPLE